MTETLLIENLRKEIEALQAKNKELEGYKKKVDQYQSDVVENAPLAIAFGYPDGRLENCNLAFSDLTGYNLEELQKIDWNKVLTPQKWNETETNILSKISPENNYIRYEKEYIHKTGRIIPVELAVKGKFDDNNKLVHFIGFVTDISERKQAEILLQKEKESIKSILDLVGIPIFVKDNDHRITRANRAFYELFGMDEDDVIGFTLAEAVPEKERDQFLEVDRMVLETGIPDIREEELSVGENVQTIITKKTRFVDEAGNNFLVGSIYDITDRKKVEIKLLKEKEYSEELINALPGLFYEISEDGKFINWNNNFEIVSGYSEKEMGQISPLDLFEGKDKIEIAKSINEVFTKGSVITGGELISKEGLRTPYYFSGKRIEFDGFPVLVGMGIDISNLKEAEKELSKHRKHLEELVKERTIDLETKNKELDNTMKVFVGRELTIRKLQERIRALEGK